MGLIAEGFLRAGALLAAGDAELLGVMWLSLKLSGAATVLSLLAGMPLGTVLALVRFPGRGLVVALVNTGMGLPPVVVGLFVSIVLWRSGPLGALELLYTPTAIVVAQFVIAVPVVTGLTLAAVQQIPERFRLQVHRARGLAAPAPRDPDPGSAPPAPRRADGRLRRGDLRGRRLADGGGKHPGADPGPHHGDGPRDGKGNFDVAIALSILLLTLTFLVNWALTWIQQRGRA